MTLPEGSPALFNEKKGGSVTRCPRPARESCLGERVSSRRRGSPSGARHSEKVVTTARRKKEGGRGGSSASEKKGLKEEPKRNAFQTAGGENREG